ncbi:MAG TPA: hypothetical protein VI564_07840 [Candidatus Nanoarchaeia archaeon]|nr:hypothetical protein [Candidatus Nanoarchaeia archaeon]
MKNKNGSWSEINFGIILATLFILIFSNIAFAESISISPSQITVSSSSSVSPSGISASAGGGIESGKPTPALPLCGNGICEDGEYDHCPSPGSGACPNQEDFCSGCYKGTCPQDCKKNDKDYFEVKVPSTFRLLVGERAKVLNYQDIEIRLKNVISGETQVCPADAKLCPDGTIVGRIGSDCDFDLCPSQSEDTNTGQRTACSMDPKECQDGSFVRRVPPSCNFAACPGETQVPNDIIIKPSVPVSIKKSSIAHIEVTTPGGCGLDADPSCLGPPAYHAELKLSEGENAEVLGINIKAFDIYDNTAYFEVSFAGSNPGCNADLCKTYICCKGDNCPLGLPKECGTCTQSICNSDAPVCDKVGTKEEGWYRNGNLVNYDKCACTAVCKNTGKGKGYFNSCNGNFIQFADCYPQESISVTIGTKKVEVVQDSSNEFVSVKSEATATTKETVLVEDNKLKLSTDSGAKEIMLPEDAKQKAIDSAKLTEVSSIELKQENGKAVYEVEGKFKSYFLWIFPQSKDITVKVDAEINGVAE